MKEGLQARIAIELQTILDSNQEDINRMLDVQWKYLKIDFMREVTKVKGGDRSKIQEIK